jgi:hypothetical protein
MANFVKLKMEGSAEVIASFQRQTRNRLGQYGKVARMAVVYEAPYAIFVHEDMETPHRTGQAKYLEQPARMFARSIGKFIRDLVRRKTSIGKALYQAGLILLKESQKLVPVDTGFLKSSGKVVVE